MAPGKHAGGGGVMAERRLLMTLDEARAAFTASALKIASSVPCSRTRRDNLLRGTGRAVGLAPEQRAQVLEHKRLINALRADGLENIVEEELEGIESYLEATEVSQVHAAG